MKKILAVVLSAGVVFSTFADDPTLGFWAFTDGNPGDDVGTVANTLGSGSWSGTGSLGGWDGQTVGTVGVMPTFSADSPGISIYAATTNNQLLARNPQSIKFTYDVATSNYGGRVNIDGLSTALSQLDNFTIEYFAKLDPEWHYSALPAWYWYSKTPLAFQSGGDAAKFVFPSGGDGKGFALQCLGPLSANNAKYVGWSYPYNDNKWHHAAAVYSRATQELTFYADYTLGGSFAYTNTPTQAALDFVMGTGLLNKRGTERFRGKIACLRVSSASYNIPDFMRTDSIPVVTNYAMAAFYDFKDGAAGTDADVVTNLVGDTLFPGKAGLTWSGYSYKGNLPRFSAERPGKYIYSNFAGDELLATEPQSLYFYPGNSTNGGGQVELKDLATALTRAEEYTIEFFFKDGTQNNYRSIIGYKVGEKVACKLNLHLGNLSSISYEVITNTTGTTLFGLSSKPYHKSSSFYDNSWHHAAIVYTASNSTSKMYIDYDSANPAAVTYTNQLTWSSHPLVLGTSAFTFQAITEAFGGHIACPRVMMRALNPTEFLMAYDPPAGTLILIK